MENKNKKSKRVFKVVMAAMSLALVAVISYGATLAILTSKTNNKENTFTSTRDVSITIEEPSWAGSTTKTYQPGETIPKDPSIKVDSSSNSSYIAARVTFGVDSDGDNNINTYLTYNEFLECATLQVKDTEENYTDGVNSNWKIDDNTKGSDEGLVLYYTGSDDTTFEEVSANASTAKIFDAVKFKDASVLTGSGRFYDTNSKRFYNVIVNVEAFAVDAQGLNNVVTIGTEVTDKTAYAKTALDNLINSTTP